MAKRFSFQWTRYQADKLGAYKITGDRIAATEGDGNGVFLNQTDDADDIIINGNSLSKTDRRCREGFCS